MSAPALKATAGTPPNVVLIMTDDQGYGELGCLGNEIIKTPHLDDLYTDAIRLTNFHVNAVCSPTRASLMTGMYASHVGVWHTIGGREIPRLDAKMMPQYFAESGYATMMTGKWHLGDNYPFRAEDRGFDEVLRIGGGSPGQVPDYWGNGLFDMHYWNGNEWQPTEGFSTDVQFDAAIDFIGRNKSKPFFCYIPTSAPHSPLGAPKEYLDLYPDLPDRVREFYAMCSNIDTNVGRLRKYLTDNDLDDNTIFIFMTDNGSACDRRNKFNLHNGNMRGKKSSLYEGGHRVPCFIHWPAGGWTGGKDIDNLTAHIDLLPTLIQLCGLEASKGNHDGRNLQGLAKGKSEKWPPRTLITEAKVNNRAEMFASAVVMQEKWRLVNEGKELYDVARDPGQRNDLADKHPDIVQELRDEYYRWYEGVKAGFDPPARIVIGAEEMPSTTLNSMDVHPIHGEGRRNAVWNQPHVLDGKMNHGKWLLFCKATGSYKFSLKRWPKESSLVFGDTPQGAKKVTYKQAKLAVGGREQVSPIDPTMESVDFEVELEHGEQELDAVLITEDGDVTSAYYVDVEIIR